MNTKHKPLAEADKIPVYCLHSKLVPVGELQPYPENPNTHPPEQLEVYLEVIRGNGWRRAITVSTRSGFITKGNGAFAAALLGQLTLVPVEYQDYASEEEELTDVIADNRLSKLAKMDNSKLAELLLRLDTGELDMRRTGYLEEDLEDFMTKVGRLPEPKFKGGDDSIAPRAGSASDVANIPISHVRMLQLFLTEDSMPPFIKKVEELQKLFGTDNVTDTIVRAIEWVHGQKV